MRKDKPVIKKYETGIEHGIIKLFSDVFQTYRSSHRWKWQFEANPQGKSWIMLAQDRNQVIGQFALRRNDLNFMGQRVTAGQSCDTMVHPDYRGKGLFIQLAKQNYRTAKADGLKVAFSFPNRASYPGYMRNLGRHRICMLKCYSYRIGYRRLLGNSLDKIFRPFFRIPNRIKFLIERHLLSDDLKIVTSSHIPNQAEELLRDNLNYEVLSVWKDLQYMKWRYQDHPDHQYDFHFLYVKNKLEALAVSRNCGENVTICELINRIKNFRQSVFLIRHLVHYYSMSESQKVVFYGHDNGFFERVFITSSFNLYPSNLIFTAQAFGDKRLENILMIPENWTLTIGDSDII